MTHDLIARNFLNTQFSQQQTAALQNTIFCTHYMITYESCFRGKINSYSCEGTMKEYVHSLFTASGKFAHQTVRSRILLSRSVKISCLQTELAAVLMEDFIHFLQAVVV